jgi:hypothetical protein
MKAVESLNVADSKELLRINRVRIHQQVLFVSDILDASRKCIDRRYLNRRDQDEQWLTITFPNEKPPQRDFRLWREILLSMAPRGRAQHRLRRFIRNSHKIWEWRYNSVDNTVRHLKRETMDIYTPTTVRGYANRPNCWLRLVSDGPLVQDGEICSIKHAVHSIISISSHVQPCLPKTPPRNFWSVIKEWGELWIWKRLDVVGKTGWLEESIANNSCIAVTDGSYMKMMFPTISSAAFVFECSRRRGCNIGSFVEHSPDAGSYRGELLGLMAIHLILKGVHEFNPSLGESIQIFSDCLGALTKVENLPLYQISTRCSHSDILKNIMIICSDLSFTQIFSHVAAHQDDGKTYNTLSRESQLNCQMDFYAKQAI